MCARARVCVVVSSSNFQARRWLLIFVASSVHVGELLKARPPVVEVVIVLVPRAGRVERADRAGRGAAALVVEHQQRVVRRSCGVVVGRSETLEKGAGEEVSTGSHQGTEE